MSTAVMSTAVMSTAVMSTAVMSTAVMSTAVMSTAVRNGTISTPRISTSRLRITRRGYALLTLIVAAPLAISALGFAVNGGGAAAENPVSAASLASVTFEHVTVQAGESLWQLAAQIAPAVDTRDVVSDIVHLNQLSSAVVQPGQTLAIPLKYAH